MGELFDNICRTLATPMPRSRALKLILGGVAGAVLVPFSFGQSCPSGQTVCASACCPSSQACCPGAAPTGGAKAVCCPAGYTCAGNRCCQSKNPNNCCGGPSPSTPCN